MFGCDTGVEITTPPTDVKFTSTQAASTISGYDSVKVRAWSVADGGKTELMNVPCSLKGVGYVASMNAPSIVNLPVYLGSTRPVTVTCTYQGKRISKVVEPYNDTTRQRTTALGGGLLGLAISAAVESSRSTSRDRFLYPDIISIEFK